MTLPFFTMPHRKCKPTAMDPWGLVEITLLHQPQKTKEKVLISVKSELVLSMIDAQRRQLWLCKCLHRNKNSLSRNGILLMFRSLIRASHKKKMTTQNFLSTEWFAATCACAWMDASIWFTKMRLITLPTVPKLFNSISDHKKKSLILSQSWSASQLSSFAVSAST